ncbi:MAG: hypothetical protein ACTSR0_02030 [Candidatus Asgardarchaeia archaeon]
MSKKGKSLEKSLSELKRLVERATFALSKVEDVVAGIVTAIVSISALVSAGILEITAQPEAFRGLLNIIMLGSVGVWAIIRAISMYSVGFMERNVIRSVYFTFILNSSILVYSYRLYLSEDLVWPYILAVSPVIVATVLVLSSLGYALFRTISKEESVSPLLEEQEKIFERLLRTNVSSNVRRDLEKLRENNLKVISRLIVASQKYANMSRGSNVLAQAIFVAMIATAASIFIGSSASSYISGENFLLIGVLESVAIVISGLILWYLTSLQERTLRKEFSKIIEMSGLSI